MSVSEYIERLTEASLDNSKLPEPSGAEQEQAYVEFLETEKLFEEVADMDLDKGWQQEVWARIDTEQDGSVDTDDTSVAAKQTENTDEAPTEGQVIHAENRFKWWPALAGLAVAAAALIGIVWVGGLGPANDPARGELEARSAPAAEEMAVMTDREESDEVMPGELERSAPETADPEEPRRAEGEAGASARDGAPANSGSTSVTATADLQGVRGGEGGEAAAPPRDAGLEMEESPDDMAAGIGRARAESGKRDKKGGWGGDKTTLDGDGGGWNGDRPVPVPQPKPQLTAGEVNDNKSFVDFQDFLRERNKTHLEPMDVNERVFIRVLDANNKPMPNASVTFAANGRAVTTTTTYADGWTLFHPRTFAGATGAEGFEVSIRSGQTEQSYQIQRGAKEKWQVRMPVERQLPARPTLDMVFLLDTTSSMADEIERLQETMIQIAADVDALPGNPEVRFGLVLFRDDDDEYVSKVFPFQTDVREFQKLLVDVDAAGGGDIPERLEVGLHRAVNDMEWGEDSTRLVFLVGDAPPHARAENKFSYAQDLQTAAGKAIKIFPVATSGLDDDGEYVFRQIAQYTMARFIFLTGGPSGTETTHAVKPGSFQPETLDRLIVRLVREELSGLELE